VVLFISNLQSGIKENIEILIKTAEPSQSLEMPRLSNNLKKIVKFEKPGNYTKYAFSSGDISNFDNSQSVLPKVELSSLCISHNALKIKNARPAKRICLNTIENHKPNIFIKIHRQYDKRLSRLYRGRIFHPDTT
jgi:hypothetical protein